MESSVDLFEWYANCSRSSVTGREWSQVHQDWEEGYKAVWSSVTAHGENDVFIDLQRPVFSVELEPKAVSMFD